jgi:DNA-directed RNA polymerase subunit RPC12/RpoP
MVSTNSWSCPHCGSTSGTWFDRSAMLDHQGNPLKYEEFPNRCNDCGKNVNAPKNYYQPSRQSDPEFMNAQNSQRHEIIQEINSCNTAINKHKKEIAKLDAKIDSLLSELQELESH